MNHVCDEVLSALLLFCVPGFIRRASFCMYRTNHACGRDCSSQYLLVHLTLPSKVNPQHSACWIRISALNCNEKQIKQGA